MVTSRTVGPSTHETAALASDLTPLSYWSRKVANASSQLVAVRARSLCHRQQRFHHRSRSVANARAIADCAAMLSRFHSYVLCTRTVSVVWRRGWKTACLKVWSRSRTLGVHCLFPSVYYWLTCRIWAVNVSNERVRTFIEDLQCTACL